ncbi:hypothetical protein OROMI_000612 [Orobanche minor]
MVNSKVLINVFLGIFFASILLFTICSQVTATEPAETFVNDTMKEIHAAGDTVECGKRDCCFLVNNVCEECCDVVDFANKICCQKWPSDEVRWESDDGGSGYGHNKTRNTNSSCCKWDRHGRYCN